jgi:hypothetical protein
LLGRGLPVVGRLALAAAHRHADLRLCFIPRRFVKGV